MDKVLLIPQYQVNPLRRSLDFITVFPEIGVTPYALSLFPKP